MEGRRRRDGWLLCHSPLTHSLLVTAARRSQETRGRLRIRRETRCVVHAFANRTEGVSFKRATIMTLITVAFLEGFARLVRGPEPFAIIGAAAGSCPTRSVSVLHCASRLLAGRS